MHRQIGTAAAALVLFTALSTATFAQSSTSKPADPKAEGIGSTSSTHNPRPSSPGPTGMEKGKASGSEVGTILQHTIHPKNVEALESTSSVRAIYLESDLIQNGGLAD